ncbi:MAG TPA: glycosyltransferase family 4 protein, partial [Anaerolineales bacterium]|nr:glycosyltransferase family 4 protein [Anaerolineales bacterium]
SFGITSGFTLLMSAKPDIVYANTWPILAQGIISLICHMRGIPLVVSVQDVYPESLLAQNRIRDGHSWIFRLLRWLDALIAGNSSALIVISDQFRELYLRDRKLSPGKVYVVPNWIDEKSFIANRPNNPIRTQHKIPEHAFLAVYGGNIGVAAGVDGAILAFANMRQHFETYLLIAGDGSNFEDCQRLAEASKNSRILFLRPWPAGETLTVLAAADLCLLPTQGEQSLVSVPSKLLSYMLASRPVFAWAVPDSEIARIILESGCGWVIPPGDPEKLSKQIVEIAALPRQELRQRGEAGRDFARRHYSKSANLSKVIEILEKTSGKGRYHDSPHGPQ